MRGIEDERLIAAGGARPDETTSWFDPMHRVRDVPGTLTQVDITIQVDRELLMSRVNEVGAGELLRRISAAAVAVLEGQDQGALR